MRQFLEEIVKNMPKHKQNKTCAMEANSPIKTQKFNDRVCFLQTGITRKTCQNFSESSSKSTSDEEIETDGEIGDGESSDTNSKYGEEEAKTSSLERQSTFGTQDDTIDGSMDDSEDGGPPPLTDASEHETSSEEEDIRDLPPLCNSSECDTSSEEDWSYDEEEVDDGVFLATSVSNLRRREVFGIETSFEERRKALISNAKKKKEQAKKGTEKGKVSLKETQELLKKTFEEDERNIKKRKSVFSETKMVEHRQMGRNIRRRIDKAPKL